VDDKIIAHMRSRVSRCRQLARDCTDEKTAKTLLLMAKEGERDIARLLANRQGQASSLD
jgi:hypothetical protein